MLVTVTDDGGHVGHDHAISWGQPAQNLDQCVWDSNFPLAGNSLTVNGFGDPDRVGALLRKAEAVDSEHE